MPIDEVKCGKCGYPFQEGVLATQAPRQPCPRCGAYERMGSFTEEIAIAVGLTVTGEATFDHSWRGQYRRMMRSFEKLHGVTPPASDFVAGDIEDGFIQFFQNAWHLKDWLRNDLATQSAVGDMETWVNGIPCMCLAADLANGSKHLALRASRTGDTSTGMRKMQFGGDSTRGLAASIIVESGGKELDALDLARQVLAAWRGYLASKGLDPTA